MNNDDSIKLYQSIANANEERVFKHWHASSISECPRAHWMKRKGIKATAPPPSAAKMLRWKAGHLIEEAIRPHLQTLVEGEVKSNERLTSSVMDVTGEYDNLATDTIIEIKSVHDYAFIEQNGICGLKKKDGVHASGRWAGKDKYTLSDVPYLNHELQNHTYVLLLREQGIYVEKIKYIYITLSGRIAVYDTEVKEELLANVTKRIDVLNKAWKSDTPPPCICEVGHPLWDSTMRFCVYRNEKEGTCCEL